MGVNDLNFDLHNCDAYGFRRPAYRMNVGKTLFAQVMEYVPWKTFGRIIERPSGDASVRTLSCADLFGCGRGGG
jgi:hypothetical protein